MQFRIVAVAAAALAAIRGVQAENGFVRVSYPRECFALCGPVVTQSQNACLNDDHPAQCICIQKDMEKLVPACQACAVNQRNSKLGPEFLPSITDLLNICGFSKTTVTTGPAATAAPMGVGAIAAIAAMAAL